MNDLDDWVQEQRNKGRTDAEIRHILEQQGLDDDRIDNALRTSSYTGFVIATALTLILLTTMAYALYEPPTQSPTQQAPGICDTQRCLANAATTCGPTTYTQTNNVTVSGITQTATQRLTLQPVADTCQLTTNYTNTTFTLSNTLSNQLTNQQQTAMIKQMRSSIQNATTTATCNITVEELTTRLSTWQATNHSVQDTLPQPCHPQKQDMNASAWTRVS